MTKYATNDAYSEQPDGLSILEKIDDAAQVNWGGTWRVPSDDEMVALISFCSRERKKICGDVNMGVSAVFFIRISA